MTSFPTRIRWSSGWLLAAVVALAALAGCRQEEQGRPMLPQKGIYGGQPDQKLDPATLDQLRQRGTRQRFT